MNIFRSEVFSSISKEYIPVKQVKKPVAAFPLFTSSELQILDQVKRKSLKRNDIPEDALVFLSSVELSTLVEMVRKGIMELHLSGKVYDKLLSGIEAPYQLQKDDYMIRLTPAGREMLIQSK